MTSLWITSRKCVRNVTQTAQTDGQNDEKNGPEGRYDQHDARSWRHDAPWRRRPFPGYVIPVESARLVTALTA